MKEHLFVEIKKSYNLVIEIMKHHAKKYNINHIQLSIILLACTKDVNVSMLANTLDITKSAVSQAITGLLMKRLVIRQNNPDDKKVYYIKPTQKAIDIKKDIYNINEAKYQQLLNKISIEEIIQMNNLIHKFNSVIKSFSNSREEIC